MATNLEVCHSFFHRLAPSCQSGTGNLHHDTDTLYSYSTPIARRYPTHTGSSIIFVSTASYSVTTSAKHYTARDRANPCPDNTFALSHIPDTDDPSRAAHEVADIILDFISQAARPRIRATTRANLLGRAAELIQAVRLLHPPAARPLPNAMPDPSDREALTALAAKLNATRNRATLRNVLQHARNNIGQAHTSTFWRGVIRRITDARAAPGVKRYPPGARATLDALREAQATAEQVEHSAARDRLRRHIRAARELPADMPIGLLRHHMHHMQAIDRAAPLPDDLVVDIDALRRDLAARVIAQLPATYPPATDIPTPDTMDARAILRTLHHPVPAALTDYIDACSAAAERRAAERRAALIQAWRNGDTSARPPYDTPVMLRIDPRDPSRIETSHHAGMPVNQAAALWRLILRAKRTGTGQSWRGKPDAPQAGHFQVDAITASGTLHAGCHTILFDELERMARALSLPTD